MCSGVSSSWASSSRVWSEVRGQGRVIQCCHSSVIMYLSWNEICRCDKPHCGESAVGTEGDSCFLGTIPREQNLQGLWEHLRNTLALCAFSSPCVGFQTVATTILIIYFISMSILEMKYRVWIHRVHRTPGVCTIKQYLCLARQRDK